MNRPWMPLYVADYLADTGHLSTVEHGAYMLLIMHYWQNGGLPNDDRRLARICRLTEPEWAECREIIVDMFDDGWRHKRIDAEAAKAEDISSKRTASAMRMHSKRAASADANAVQVQTQSQPQSQEDAHASSARAEAASKSEADPMKAKSADLCRRLIGLFRDHGNNPNAPLPDTGLAEVWVRQGFDPDIIFAIIGADVRKGRSRASLRYYENQIREAHERKAPPPPPADAAVTADQWEQFVSRHRASPTKWPYRQLGPSPDEAGCKAPVEILTRHGWRVAA